MEPQNNQTQSPTPVPPAFAEHPATPTDIQPVYSPVPTTGAMPPSVQPAKKSRKKLLIIIAIAVLLAVGAGALFFYLKTSALTPEERFTKALENHLQTTTIRQDYAIKSSAANIWMDTQSDFSDPKNSKAKGEFSYDISQLGVVMQVNGEAVSPNAEEAFAKYSNYKVEFMEQEADLTTGFKDKWIKLDNTDYVKETDMAATIYSINTPLGEVIVGNFDAGLRKEIMDKIEAGNIYTITSSENVEEDGKKLVKYEVKLDEDKVGELNDFVAERLGIENTLEEDKPDNMTLWIDKETNQFEKVYISEEVESQEVEVTVKLSDYGVAVTIETPTDAMPYDEFEKRLTENLNILSQMAPTAL